MYWAGYVYRYWHYFIGETNKEIYKITDANTVDECWLVSHTLNVEMATDDLKGIYTFKNKR